MNKRIRITIILITVFIMLLIGGIVLLIKNEQKKELKFNQNIYNKFVDKIENKDTFLLYLNNSGEECFLCSDVDIMIQYYKEIYDLDIYTIDELKMSSEYYYNVIKYVDDRKDYYQTPAIIFIKDGKAVDALNRLTYEEYLKEFLINNQFIEEDNHEKMINKISSEKLENNTLDDYINEEKNKLVIIYNYSTQSYDLRKKVRELAKKYDFSYLLSFYGRGNYNADYEKILKLINKDIFDENPIPMMYIMNNGKVIDYTSSREEAKIKKFLTKNKIVS